MATQYTDPMTEALMQQFLTGQTAQTDALNAIASRPQKQTQVTTTAPVEFADMLARRNQIGAERAMLNEALKQRETFGYGLANALASMPAQQGAGSWLGDFARGFGSAFNARANAAIDRAKQDYEAAQADLATALAFDKAMGDVQQQNIGYTDVPYVKGSTRTTTGGGVGMGNVMQNVDISNAPLPEKPNTWGETTLQSYATDPDTGVRTKTGVLARKTLEYTNPEGINTYQANANSYAKTFTVPNLTRIANAAGGGRGIDTIPEINIKGGPELTGTDKDSKTFINAVQDQAWDIADQIIKANPSATISREELANAFLNNFNHSIRPEYRVVGQLAQGEKRTAQMPTQEQSVSPYAKYGF